MDSTRMRSEQFPNPSRLIKKYQNNFCSSIPLLLRSIDKKKLTLWSSFTLKAMELKTLISLPFSMTPRKCNFNLSLRRDHSPRCVELAWSLSSIAIVRTSILMPPLSNHYLARTSSSPPAANSCQTGQPSHQLRKHTSPYSEIQLRL